MARKPPNGGGMSPLQRLILHQMHAKGWSPKDVEARGVKHATLHRYMNPLVMKQLPREKTLKELADGLDLDVEFLTEAAKESVGGQYVEWPWRKKLTYRGAYVNVTAIIDHADLAPLTWELMAESLRAMADELSAVGKGAGEGSHIYLLRAMTDKELADSKDEPIASWEEMPRAARPGKSKKQLGQDEQPV